ncbi:MAG: hydroxyacid dehydrogenase [Thermoplasmatales archaeon]|nr:hydroxyacid dehydrogenase [Thermoplasmatales archaeon]
MYSDQDLAKEIADADVVVITSQFKLTKWIIDQASNLKGIVKYGSKPGLDNVDISAANARKIPVAFTAGANADTVAEYTVMLMLALIKKIPSIISDVKDQRWRQRAELGLELLGKTVGIFGLGTIGMKVAQKLCGFGVKMIATDPYILPEKSTNLGIKLVNFDTLLSESDIVTLHANVTNETRHIIGTRELSMMKRTAYLVNTARGELVDEKALYEALRTGKLAGAGLDVYEKEPPSVDNPLLGLSNVILTPHVASWTTEALEKEANTAMDEVVRIITGKRPINLANPEIFSGRE